MKNIPVLHVTGKSLAETYEKALIELKEKGIRFKTQYDKPGDPESIDATMNLTIEEPLSDPMIHKAFIGGIEDLREYVYELDGLKDEWTRCSNDPNDKRWQYTYPERLTKYGTHRELVNGKPTRIGLNAGKGINQIESVIDKLCNQPFTRQAQAITWNVEVDNDSYDPACLQSMWFRILEDEGVQYVNTNCRMRSNDAWGASFINLFGFIQFINNNIVKEIEKRTGKPTKMGRFNHHCDSYHIYGKNIKTAKEMLFDRLDTTTFEDRVYNFHDKMIQEMYKESEEGILAKIKEYNDANPSY